MTMAPTILRQALLFEYITLAWNVLATFRASSVALAGFALDSLIEIGASAMVIWELTEPGMARQKRALHLIEASFFAWAVTLSTQSWRSFYFYLHPNTSSASECFTLCIHASSGNGKRPSSFVFSL